MVRRMGDPKILTFFMPENTYLLQLQGMIGRRDEREDYSAKGGALTVVAGDTMPEQYHKLFWDDRGVVQRIEAYHPLNPPIVDEIMEFKKKNPNEPFLMDISPLVEVLGVIREEDSLRGVSCREYIEVYTKEKMAKVDYGIHKLENMEVEEIASEIIKKMHEPEEYWVLDSIIHMRELGPLRNFKTPLRKTPTLKSLQKIAPHFF